MLRAFDEEYGTTSSSIQPVYSERADEREGAVSPSLDGGVLRVIGIVGAALAILLLVISALDDDEDAQVLPATTPVSESTTSTLVGSVPSASAPIERPVRADGEEMSEPRANGSEVYSVDGSVGSGRALGAEDAFAEEVGVDSVTVSVDASLRADIEPALREIPAEGDRPFCRLKQLIRRGCRCGGMNRASLTLSCPRVRCAAGRPATFSPCTPARRTVCATLFRVRFWEMEAWGIRTGFCASSPMQKESSYSAPISSRYPPVFSHESPLRGGCPAAPASTAVHLWRA